MEIDPSHNDALKNVCKVKEMLKNFTSMMTIQYRHSLDDAIELLEKTEEILAKG